MANALNAGNMACAQIAALHLKLPELKLADIPTARKYNFDPNEPRDGLGRWIGEDDTSSPSRDMSGSPNVVNVNYTINHGAVVDKG